jgi:hypothetical protein
VTMFAELRSLAYPAPRRIRHCCETAERAAMRQEIIERIDRTDRMNGRTLCGTPVYPASRVHPVYLVILSTISRGGAHA